MKQTIMKSLFLIPCFLAHAFAQDLGFERDRHKQMLELIKNDVRKNYYDPTFKNIELEDKWKATKEKIDKATSVGQMSSLIAQFLLDFDDSHLFFIPPGKVNKVNYGFDFTMVGDKCFVYRLDKDSDAAKKGLEVGDELYSIDGFEPTRDNLWKMRYAYFTLRPRGGMNLVVIKPDGNEVDYAIKAKITQGKSVIDLTGMSDAGSEMWEFDRQSEKAQRRSEKQYFYDKLDGVFIWRMPEFSLEPAKVDDIFKKFQKSSGLVIDLRGNGGGRVDMLLRLIANIIATDVKVSVEKRRKETKDMIAKSRGNDSYKGKIVVLIDSRSGSASEVFARVIQIEQRGIVIGDRSAGAVMESMFFPREIGMDSVAFFGTSITIADLIMKDGKSLEKNGVIPDTKVLPTGADLATRRDPAMAAALVALAITITPESAGAIFPEPVDR